MKTLGAHSYLKQSDGFRWQISGMNKYFPHTIFKIMFLANVLGFLWIFLKWGIMWNQCHGKYY